MYLFRKDLEQLKAPEISVPKAERMMCLNESCVNPLEIVSADFEEIMQRAPQNRYQADVSGELRQALADYAGVDAAQILFGNGADDLIYHLFVAVREDANSFATALAPSYFDYKTFAREVGLQTRFVNLDREFGFDLDEYISLAREANCKLAILCNPNNPTGNLFDMNDLRHIIRSIPDKPILVDETYFEYSKVSLVKELGEFPNLIIIRSFSKAFAAAGLRFGYVVSSAENILQLRKVQTTFHTSLLVQAFALAILRNRESFLKIVSQTIAIRDELYHWLIGVEGISVKNSSTNFLTFSLGEQSSELFNHLITQGIALRDVGAHPVLKDHLRVTISCMEDVEAFKIALVKFLG